ncbi:MAG TPA: DUF6111 family protein [Alphaproteobacteria bacterium]|nr:DUF6111 family protein [Alphaproteobacteria bacterium]
MRLALTVILPLLLPSAIYFAYVFLAREGPRDGQAAPWFWLLASGLALSVAALIVLSNLEGAEPGSVYHPPREVDGRIEPGFFGPRGENASQ